MAPKSSLTKGVEYPAISVSFFCHDGQGKYLFNKRSQNCRDEHGRWDNGGGSLDFGSTVEETLRREIKEEYGADVIEAEFLGYRDVLRENDGVKTHWVSIDFRVLLDKSQVKNGEPHKFDELGWFSLDELPTPLHSQLPAALRKYRAQL